MKRNVKWIFLAAIAVISIGAYAAVLLKPVEAQAERAVKGSLESQFTVSASILPVSGMVLNSITAGNVSEIPFLPGMEVKEGEILIKTDSASQTTLDIQREQFRQQLISARQEYERLSGPTVPPQRPSPQRKVSTCSQRKTMTTDWCWSSRAALLPARI